VQVLRSADIDPEDEDPFQWRDAVPGPYIGSLWVVMAVRVVRHGK
jgi:hypothetical protein